MKRLLLGLSLLLLLFAVSGATAVAQASTLLSDDYEGAVRWNPNSSGWAIITTRAYGGTHSAHAPSSPNNLMIYGPFDLSAATAAKLSFQLWYYAPKASFPPGSQATAGAFLGGYSTNGSSYTFPYQWSGSTSGEWWPTEFDLGGWSLLGQSKVWIALGTTAYASALYSEGSYVEDLTITAAVPDTVPPTTTATGVVNGAWCKAAFTVGLAAKDNAGGSGVASTEYSLDGTAWTAGTSIPHPGARRPLRRWAPHDPLPLRRHGQQRRGDEDAQGRHRHAQADHDGALRRRGGARPLGEAQVQGRRGGRQRRRGDGDHQGRELRWHGREDVRPLQGQDREHAARRDVHGAAHLADRHLPLLRLRHWQRATPRRRHWASTISM